MKNQKSKIKNVIFFVFIFHLSSFIFHLGTANAQGISLRVSPTLIKIKTPAPSETNSPLTIENLSNEPVDLKVELKQFKASDKLNGEIEYLSDKEIQYDILNKIQVWDEQGKTEVSELSLSPRQKKDLQINILLSDEETEADYYFSVLFLTNSNLNQEQNDTSVSGQTSFTNINAGIAVNVLLSVLPKDGNSKQTNMLIEEFSSPQIIESGPLPFTVKIQNNGSNYINPKGTITIKNMFGQLIGKVDIPPQNVLANSSRYLNSSNQMSSDLSSLISHLSTPKAVWNEHFLLGFYEATLSIQTEPGTIPLTQTIHFTALPLKLISGIIIAIIMFLIIKKRVKAKMSEK